MIAGILTGSEAAFAVISMTQSWQHFFPVTVWSTVTSLIAAVWVGQAWGWGTKIKQYITIYTIIDEYVSEISCKMCDTHSHGHFLLLLKFNIFMSMVHFMHPRGHE